DLGALLNAEELVVFRIGNGGLHVGRVSRLGNVDRARRACRTASVSRGAQIGEFRFITGVLAFSEHSSVRQHKNTNYYQSYFALLYDLHLSASIELVCCAEFRVKSRMAVTCLMDARAPKPDEMATRSLSFPQCPSNR